MPIGKDRSLGCFVAERRELPAFLRAVFAPKSSPSSGSSGDGDAAADTREEPDSSSGQTVFR